MRTLYLASVYLHILAAIAWIGGMVIVVAILAPLLRRPEMRAQSAALFHAFGVRFRPLGWLALGTLVVTGAYNVSVHGYGLSDWLSGRVFSGTWGHTLLHKVSIVLVILVVSLLHDFWIGPRALALAASAPDSEERVRYRRAATWVGRATFLAALVVVWLAVSLVR